MASLQDYLKGVYSALHCIPEGVNNSRECAMVDDSLIHALGLILNARKRYCNWKQWVSFIVL